MQAARDFRGTKDYDPNKLQRPRVQCLWKPKEFRTPEDEVSEFFLLFNSFKRHFSIPFLFEIYHIYDKIFRVDIRAVEREFKREIVQQICNLFQKKFYFVLVNLK